MRFLHILYIYIYIHPPRYTYRCAHLSKLQYVAYVHPLKLLIYANKHRNKPDFNLCPPHRFNVNMCKWNHARILKIRLYTYMYICTYKHIYIYAEICIPAYFKLCIKLQIFDGYFKRQEQKLQLLREIRATSREMHTEIPSDCFFFLFRDR